MKKTLVLLAAAALPLGACTSTMNDDTLASAGTGAAIGAAGGAGVAAVTGGDLLTGAAIGAAVGGLSGAVWADRNGDGRADGYVYQNQYYEGQPGQYQSASAANCPSVGGTALKTGVAGAAVGAGAGALIGGLGVLEGAAALKTGVAGAAVGAGAGALIGGLGVLEGAAIGAAVGGLGGAVWADSNRDGCVDGYIREGQYYPGAPTVQNTNVSYTGERG